MHFVIGLFLAATMAVSETPRRVALCHEDNFMDADATYSAAAVRGPVIAADSACLQSDIDSCPRVPLDGSAMAYAGAEAGGWVCVTNGRTYGWTEKATVVRGPLRVAAAARQ